MKCLKEYMARPVRPLALARSYLCALSASLPLFQLAVRWLEHSCHYQYLDELLQYIRFGLMDVDTLHTVAMKPLSVYHLYLFLWEDYLLLREGY